MLRQEIAIWASIKEPFAPMGACRARHHQAYARWHLFAAMLSRRALRDATVRRLQQLTTRTLHAELLYQIVDHLGVDGQQEVTNQ